MNQRYITPYPLPTPYERELLDILQEEAAEVILAISKIKRFGLGDGDPQRPGANNHRDLSREVGEFLAVRHLCIKAGLIRPDDENQGTINKFPKLAIYMQTEPPVPEAPATAEEFDRRFPPQ